MPAGYIVVVDTADDINDWSTSIVHVTGLDGILFPEDPEPEFVSINEDNIAVVTLQENNGIVLIDCETKEAFLQELLTLRTLIPMRKTSSTRALL